jgi:hypothetical protein
MYISYSFLDCIVAVKEDTGKIEQILKEAFRGEKIWKELKKV